MHVIVHVTGAFATSLLRSPHIVVSYMAYKLIRLNNLKYTI